MPRRRTRESALAEMSIEGRQNVLYRLHGEMYLRASAVGQQARRLRENRQPTVEFQADLWLLAEALRATLRAADACLPLTKGEHRHNLEIALQEVKTIVPDVVNIRDVLEHFDDYLFGIGKLSQPGVAVPIFYERGESIRVHVGSMTLDVDVAEGVAAHLANVAITGTDFVNPSEQTEV